MKVRSWNTLVLVGVVADKGAQKMYQFAAVAGIEPSTMQTKIRAMIRYGFVRDGNVCPLFWTRMGSLWNDLYTVGNFSAAKQIYELILSISLSDLCFQQYTSTVQHEPSEW